MKLMDLYKELNITDDEYFEINKRLGRRPNTLETYLFSAMWSEHCGYKHSKLYLEKLPKVGAVGADENAGGVTIGDHVVVFKVESHNHPSAVEPFQGAATGIGGIIRDIIAVGARPIALLDLLKFGKINQPSVKHLLDGVVKGISAYGNSIGVPTVGGETSFDESYTRSPLVNVMAVGIVHKDKITTAKATSGGTVILIGSHTGRDGIHGASFASKELSANSKEDRPSVQIGDPFMGKNVIESTLEILDIPEIICCQDCGAAGLLSSTSEMVLKGDCGLNLFLDRVHLREEEMHPWEIMLSESQERMVFVVEPEAVDKVLKVAQKYDIPASIIGETCDDKLYNLYWQGDKVASLPVSILCNGPKYVLADQIPEYIDEFKNKDLVGNKFSIDYAIEKLLAEPGFASKKWIFEQYDHMVGNTTSIKPGTPGSSGIWIPEEGGVLGLTIDSKPKQVFLDPYNGTKNTIWEAFRNLVSNGFTPKGITNCLNYGNPEKTEVSYQFVNSIKGMSDACIEANIPVVSGNVSFYNESPCNRVYPTPAIGMVGYIDNYKNIISNRFESGQEILLIGRQIDQDSKLGGSLYQKVLYDFLGGEVDEINSQLELTLKDCIFELNEKNLIKACVDISDGGLFGALFEGIKSSNCGFKGDLYSFDYEKELFGEVNGRYLLSTNALSDTKLILEKYNMPFKVIGMCNHSNIIEFNDYKTDLGRLIELYDNSIELEMAQ